MEVDKNTPIYSPKAELLINAREAEFDYVKQGLVKLGFDNPRIIEIADIDSAACYCYSEIAIGGYRPVIVRCFSAGDLRDWYVGSVPDADYEKLLEKDHDELTRFTDGYLLPSDHDKVIFRLMVEFFEYHKRAKLGYQKEKAYGHEFCANPDQSLDAHDMSFSNH